MRIDEMFRLAGDRDEGAGLHCRVCDTGGLPVAYLCPDWVRYPYRSQPEVAQAHGIGSLLGQGKAHARMVHDLHVDVVW
jgi:hypothetical protein